MEKVYLDNAATTHTDSRVLESIMTAYKSYYGNASSLHQYGTVIKEKITESRKAIANYLDCFPEEIIFTSGGTESNNMAIKGIAFSNHSKGNHIIVSSIEHECILNVCNWLEKQGFFITYLPVDNNGLIDLNYLDKCINSKTILVSVMHVNNEIGTIQPINEIAGICKKHGVYYHSDICQSFGKIPVNIEDIDLVTINSHKIYGPKGIGALIIKKGTKITPLLHGGGQEFGLRSTTENFESIIGFLKAIEICFSEMESENQRIKELQNKLITLLTNIEGIYFNGSLNKKIPNIINFCINGLEGEAIRLLLLLDDDGVAISSGSACSSNSNNHASHVLQAIGLNQLEARGSIRVSLGRFNTESDITLFVESLQKNIKKLVSTHL